MNSYLLVVLFIFIILELRDLRGFIRGREPARVVIVNIAIMAISLAIGLLLAIGKRPTSPPQWIEQMLKAIGVVN